MKKTNIPGLFVNTKDFRVIIPILNEENILKSNSFSQFLSSIPFEITFVDSCSVDSSAKIIKSYGFELLTYEGEKSIYQACKSVAVKTHEPNVIILPVDCTVNFDELLSHSSPFIWGGFLKKYTQTNVGIKIYLFLQNYIRTKWFGNLVWTNVIFCKTKEFILNGSLEGFLEDVILSDNLKRVEKPIILKGPCVCSFRKYESNILRRLFINLKVMIYYRFRIKSIKELKDIYSK